MSQLPNLNEQEDLIREHVYDFLEYKKINHTRSHPNYMRTLAKYINLLIEPREIYNLIIELIPLLSSEEMEALLNNHDNIKHAILDRYFLEYGIEQEYDSEYLEENRDIIYGEYFDNNIIPFALVSKAIDSDELIDYLDDINRAISEEQAAKLIIIDLINYSPEYIAKFLREYNKIDDYLTLDYLIKWNISLDSNLKNYVLDKINMNTVFKKIKNLKENDFIIESWQGQASYIKKWQNELEWFYFTNTDLSIHTIKKMIENDIHIDNDQLLTRIILQNDYIGDITELLSFLKDLNFDFHFDNDDLLVQAVNSQYEIEEKIDFLVQENVTNSWNKAYGEASDKIKEYMDTKRSQRSNLERAYSRAFNTVRQMRPTEMERVLEGEIIDRDVANYQPEVFVVPETPTFRRNNTNRVANNGRVRISYANQPIVSTPQIIARQPITPQQISTIEIETPVTTISRPTMAIMGQRYSRF